MAITQTEARQQILAELAWALDEVAAGVACLGEAYELLPDASADRLESMLFRPAQRALAGGKRALAGFGRRYELITPELGSSPSAGLPSQGVKSFVERAVAAAAGADRRLAELQDSMLPVEAGDTELRAGLAGVRELLAVLPGAAREFLRTLGR